MEGVVGVAGVSFDRGVPEGVTSPPSRDVRTVGRSSIAVSPRNGAVAGSGANLQARLVCLVRSRRRLGTKNPSLRRAMLLCPAAAAAASARWVRCRASTSGPEEPPRAPVTRVRRRRRVTREGTSDPSRPEPSEVSGADKDARAAAVAPARREEGGETGGAVDHSAGAGRGGRVAVAVASAVGRGPGGSTRPGASTPPSSRARWRNFVASWRRRKRHAASSVVNVATAFSRLGRHLSDDQRGTLDGQAWYLALETRTLALLPELSGWAASSVTWWLARAEPIRGRRFGKRWNRR